MRALSLPINDFWFILGPAIGSVPGAIRWVRSHSENGLTFGKLVKLGLFRFRRKENIRFSASALLRVRSVDNEDQFLLVRGGPRSDPYWGPVGGVLKYFPSRTQRKFDEMRIRLHRTGDTGNGMTNDLRLLIPSKNIFKFLKWYRTDQGRESIDQAILREMVEELGWQEGESEQEEKVGHYELLEMVTRMGIEEVFDRPIIQLGYGPVFGNQDGKEFFHLRMFYVLEIVQNAEFEPWLGKAIEGALKNRTLWAKEDLLKEDGGSSGIPIGGHSRAILGIPPL